MSSGQFTEKKMYRSMSSVYSKLPGTYELAVVGSVVCQFHPGSKASDDLAAGHSRLTVVQAGVLRTWVFTFETRSALAHALHRSSHEGRVVSSGSQCATEVSSLLKMLLTSPRAPDWVQAA
jgi:hypothetical protein